MDINQRQGRYVKVPRELYDFFKGNPAASRLIMNFFETLAAKTDNSSEGLSDVEQKSLTPVFARIGELERRLNDLEKTPIHHQISELSRKIADLQHTVATGDRIQGILREIEDLKRSV